VSTTYNKKKSNQQHASGSQHDGQVQQVQEVQQLGQVPSFMYVAFDVEVYANNTDKEPLDMHEEIQQVQQVQENRKKLFSLQG
jgi:hypothetical protein